MQTWLNGAGALTSVALIFGLGVWGYKLAVRDVSGIPVIRALEGPSRVAPEDPGGELALHQGLAVNEIAAEGTAAPAAGTLTLAPRAATLGDDDQPMGEAWTGAGGEDIAGAAPGQVTVPTDPEARQPVPEAAAIRPDEPLPDGPVERMTDGDGLAQSLPATAIAADIPGVAASPRPAGRPGTLRVATAAGTADGDVDPLAEAAAAAVAAALAPQETIELGSADLVEGMQLVQIGAFADEAQARLGWERAAVRYGALMSGKRRVVEAAESGGETFYRLRVEGFADAEDARRFCATLRADNAECVPAVVR
ncbi:MAG: SPOR domain-containing protein [Rhodobacteraceae bacterium]|nr:SPOR domain-containing protein [Paracoccaceae bacterium]